MTTKSELRERFTKFFFPIESDQWLAVLRIGLGFQTILYTWSLRADWNYLLADRGGLISRRVSEAILSAQTSWIPRLSWFVEAGRAVGVNEERVLSCTWVLLLIAGSALIFGVFCRTFAVTAWFVHLATAKSGGLMAYGVDNFMTIGLFYLSLSPLPDQYSLVDRQWRGKCGRAAQDRELLGFRRRVLQLHLCLVYFFGGLSKALGTGWWDGSNLWRALARPPFNFISPEILLPWKIFFPITGILIMALEIGYPFLIWPKQTRHIWLLSACVMHFAIGFSMGMHLFALVMIILNIAAFAPDLAKVAARFRAIVRQRPGLEKQRRWGLYISKVNF